MSILQRAIAKELWPPLLGGVFLFSGLLLFGYFFVSSRWLQGVPVDLILRWLALQLPDTLVKTLPMAAVFMTMVAFGRLHSDRELVAMRAGGVGANRAALPVLGAGLVLSLFGLWLGLWAAPQSNVEARALYWDSIVGSGLGALSQKNIDLGGVSVHWNDYDKKTRQILGVRVEWWHPDGPHYGKISLAPKGSFEGNRLMLPAHESFSLDLKTAAAWAAEAPKSPKTPLEVQAEYERLLLVQKQIFSEVSLPAKDQKPLVIETDVSRSEAIARFADSLGADADGWAQLQRRIQKAEVGGKDWADARLELSRKLALPFGSLALVLLALPLALRFGGGLGIGLGLALLTALLYYATFAVGIAIGGGVSGWAGWLWPWLANLLAAVVGLIALKRST